jgi:hypothetical protein
LGEYVKYLGDGTRNNSWLVAHGQQAKPVAMAFGYWQLRPDVCSGLSEAKFRANQKADDLRELMVYASLVYLIGHEFCHHKYHDNVFKMVEPEQRRLDATRGMDVSREVTPSEQIEKEQRADLFSFHKMVEMDYPPMAAMPVLVFFLGFEGFSPEQSPDADHPSAVVRFGDMIDATKRDSEFMNLIKQHHLEPQWDAFSALAAQFQTSPHTTSSETVVARRIGANCTTNVCKENGACASCVNLQVQLPTSAKVLSVHCLTNAHFPDDATEPRQVSCTEDNAWSIFESPVVAQETEYIVVRTVFHNRSSDRDRVAKIEVEWQ